MSSRLLFVVLLGSVFAACGGGGGAAPVPAPSAPVPGAHAAQIGAAALVTDTATALRFFGQSSDAAGGAITYAWDFDGDGLADSTAQSPQHTFGSTGSKTVRLTVADDAGRVNTAEAVVGVFDAPEPAPPAVALHAWMLNGTAPCEVYCRATAVDPDGGAIASYAWDFDGDGTPETTGASPTVVTLLPDAGPVEIAVTAMDDEGAESTATATVTLCEPGSYPEGAPAVMIDVPGGTLVTATGTPLDLVAVGSDLDGGALASIEWDLDDDGTFGDLSGREISPSFVSEGVHRVRVRVTDDEGNAPHEAEVHVLVQDTVGPAGPAAWAWAETLIAVPGTGVQFHGLGEDPDNPVLTYSWDMDGDGTEDASTQDPVFSFALPGIYRPRLAVEDTDGNVSTSDLTVLVEICGDTSTPYFRYACDDVVLLNGGAPQMDLAPAAGAGAPTTYQVLYKSGPAVGDFAADELGVSAHTGQSVPPPTVPIAVPAGGVVPLDLLSMALNPPPRITCYTVGVRLVDPGVRVQVLSCQACVVHDVVVASMPLILPLTDDYQGELQVRVDPTRVAGLQVTLPDVYEVQVLFSEQTPALAEITPIGILQSGWMEAGFPGGHRFFTTTSPIPPNDSLAKWQFRHDTAAGTGRGPPLTAVRIRLLDENGVLLGMQDFTVP